MTGESDLAELKLLYARKDSMDQQEGEAWVERVSELLHRLNPDRANRLDRLTPYLFINISDAHIKSIWHQIGGVLRAAIADAEREPSSPKEPPINQPPDEAIAITRPHMEKLKNPKTVFVIHGRNEKLRVSLFTFLRALGLEPLEWSQAVRNTGKAAPYIGEILDVAFGKAQAVVVLLTPDDEVNLAKSLWVVDEPDTERTVRMQARPNVLFEAGMAFGSHPDRTILVQIGQVKPFSDVAGRHVVRLDDSAQKRTDLAHRLEQAGCPVDMMGQDWITVGSFTHKNAEVSRSPQTSDSRLEIRKEVWGPRNDPKIIITNVGDGLAQDIVVLADDAPIANHECWIAGQEPTQKLRPGEEWALALGLTMGSPRHADITVTWTTENGVSHKTERLIQFGA